MKGLGWEGTGAHTASALLSPPRDRFTAKFLDPRLETEFQGEHFEASVRKLTRFTVGLTTIVFLAYGVHDAWLVPEMHVQAWTIRYGIFLPIALGVLLFSRARAFSRFHQQAMLAYGLAANLTVIWIGALAPPTGFFLYTGYALLFVALGPFLVKMNVGTQIVYTLLSASMFMAFAIFVSNPSAAVFASVSATILAMGGIGTLVAWQLENQSRDIFLQRRTIATQMVELDFERSRSEALLLNILPANIAERLKAESRAIADGFAEVTVLFADIVGFTKLSARLHPEELVARLNVLFSSFDDLAEELGVDKIKTIGDAYMAVGGLRVVPGQHAHAVAEMGLRMIEQVRVFGSGADELSVRVGINTGPVVAGVIGKKKFIYDVWGDAVNTASRMESHGTPGHVHVTEETAKHLADDYVLEPRGEIDVKGKGPMRTYYLVGRKLRAAGESSGDAASLRRQGSL